MTKLAITDRAMHRIPQNHRRTTD